MPAAKQAGLSGLAVATAAAGGILLYSGIRGVPTADALRQLVSGQPITPTGQGVSKGLAANRAQVTQELSQAVTKSGPVPTTAVLTSVGGTATGARVADDARRYLGAPYVWGAAGPTSFDCSGLVTWVLGHDLGIQLPSARHTITTQFYIWAGARTIDRGSCAAGDLVCWPSHIGIAIDADNMIHAPHTGTVVQVSRIWAVPAPIIRRPAAYGTGAL